MRVTGAMAMASVLVVACGGPEPIDNPPQPPVSELASPLLRAVAPMSLRAGEKLTIFGQDFVDTATGETRLTLEGTYQSTSGKSAQVQLEVVPDFRNQGVLSWTFGPNIPFSGEGETGVFRGVVRAQNVGRDGQIKEAAQPLGVELQVLPSILIKQARAQNVSCGAALTQTTDDSKLVLELTTTGLKAGTKVAPLRYVYSFMKEQFQLTGFLSNQLAVDPESLFGKKGPVCLVDLVTDGNASSLGSGALRNMTVVKGGVDSGLGALPSGLDSLFGLQSLATAPLPDVAESAKVTLNIVAIDSTGAQASRTVELEVWTPVQVKAEGGSGVVQSFDPVPVTGCIPGGDIGRDVTYTETSSDTRTRSFQVSSTLSGGFDIKVARLNAEFGVEVNSEVSSSKSRDLAISAKILPREFGVFYRQTLQLERRAKLIQHGPCGDSRGLGEVILTDWAWSPDLAKGAACPPLPASNLAPGQVF
jgi:hypothetical protein